MIQPHGVHSSSFLAAAERCYMSYCNTEPHFFMIAVENANVILKKYEALACFTLAGP